MKMNGTEYKPGAVVVVSMDLLPLFGLIKDIIVFDVSEYYLVCELLQTICFDVHFHSYEVAHVHTHGTILCRPKDLIDRNVLGLYRRHSLFVTFKYNIMENV